MDEESDIYVCITHKCIIPCQEGDRHLVSNWPADVRKILENDN